jgi:hypothetical protein
MKTYIDVMVELTDKGYEISVGDIEGDNDSWDYELATFKYKNQALRWAMDMFLKVKDKDKQLTILDYEDKTMEFKVYDKDEVVSLLEVINSGM